MDGSDAGLPSCSVCAETCHWQVFIDCCQDCNPHFHYFQKRREWLYLNYIYVIFLKILTDLVRVHPGPATESWDTRFLSMGMAKQLKIHFNPSKVGKYSSQKGKKWIRQNKDKAKQQESAPTRQTKPPSSCYTDDVSTVVAIWKLSLSSHSNVRNMFTKLDQVEYR